MKTIKSNIFFLVSIIISVACTKERNHDLKSDEQGIRITRCFTPVSSHKAYFVRTCEYRVPAFFTEALDSVIESEQKCECYGETTGFLVIFSSSKDSTVIIHITPLPNIGVGDYSNRKGFFIYNKHFFICDGDVEDFPFQTIREPSVKMFLPEPYDAEIDDSWSSWSFEYHCKKMTLINHYKCFNAPQ